jgi:hypothetical protein
VILAVISNNISNLVSSGINVKNLPTGGGNSNMVPLFPGGPQVPNLNPFTNPKLVTPAKAASIAAVTQQQI